MLWCRGAQMVPNLYFSFYISKNEDKKQNIKRQYLHCFFHKEISFKVGLSDRNERPFQVLCKPEKRDRFKFCVNQKN